MLNNFIYELRTIFRDEGLLLFLIIVPLIYPLAYSWIYNNEVAHDVAVVVVDQSHSAESREFARRFDASPHTNVAYRASSMAEAQDLIAHQKAFGVLFFPEDFGRNINRHEQAHVSVYCDMSLLLAYKNIYQTVMAVSSDMNKGIQAHVLNNKTVREDEVATAPLTFEEVAMFNTTGGYANALLPAVLVIIIQQTILLGFGLTFGTRRERGQPLLRSRNGGFLAILLAYLLVYIPIATYLWLAVPEMFSLVSIIYPGDLALLILPYLLSCILFSMFTMQCIRQREDVMLIVVFTSVPLVLMSGVSWPMSNMPAVWYVVGHLFPSTLGVEAFIRMSSMGCRISEVQNVVLMLWIQALIYGALAYLTHRFCSPSTTPSVSEENSVEV